MQVVSKPFAAVLSCAKVKPAPIWFLAPNGKRMV
jgi:hypothetical protein